MDDRDLMSIRADTLFTNDARGRMLRSNELKGRPAPRLFLGRTVTGHVVRFGERVPDEVARELAEIVNGQLAVDALPIRPSMLAPVREALSQHAPITREGGGPAYRFPESIARMGEVAQVTDANVKVVRDGAAVRYVGVSVVHQVPGEPDVLTGGFTRVLPADSGPGIGAGLKLETIAYARSRGYRAKHSALLADNVPMLRTDEAMGFRLYRQELKQ